MSKVDAKSDLKTDEKLITLHIKNCNIIFFFNWSVFASPL